MADEARSIASLDGKRLLEEVGAPFLAYMLNVTEDAIRNRLDRGQALGTSQETALAEVASAAAQSFPDAPEVGYSLLPTLLMAYNEQHGTTSVNALRHSCGGDLPDFATADGTLARSLEQLARDCYPAVLLPPSRPEIAMPGHLEHLARVMHRHPIKDVFEKQVMDDTVLATLFPSYDEASGHSGQYYTNLGHGGSTQLWMLAEELISAAHSSLELDEDADRESVTARALTNLEELRTLLSGDAVRTKARLGIAGVQLTDDQRITTPWGTLRNTTKAEHERITNAPATPADAVLEVPVDLRLNLGSGMPPEGESGTGHFGKVSLALHTHLKECWTKLALSIFLGVERDRPISATNSWTIFDEVFRGTSGMSFAFAPWMGSWALTAEDLAEVGAWADIVHQRYHRSLAVAADRIIKAVAQRPDPADGLIDAVISLENLFGTSSAQGELIFRISTGCAWLLETDPQKRRQLRKEIRTIYDERSTIVHGGEASPDIGEHRDQAIRLVRRSLRALFKDRPELIRNRDRSSELTLGA